MLRHEGRASKGGICYETGMSAGVDQTVISNLGTDFTTTAVNCRLSTHHRNDKHNGTCLSNHGYQRETHTSCIEVLRRNLVQRRPRLRWTLLRWAVWDRARVSVNGLYSMQITEASRTW